MSRSNRPSYILPLIVFSQFCCTSLWFAGNGVMEDLIPAFQLPSEALGHLTSAVQFGFILGTLVFAILSLADRFAPSRVFFFSALIAAIANLGLVVEQNNFISLLLLRFLCGFFLAGIYPVGMKIAADYYRKGLGKSLSYLVGALVLGTAFPHLLNSYQGAVQWQQLILAISLLAVLGGLLMLLFVPNGPYRKRSLVMDIGASYKVFRSPEFRSVSMGYFGHMWELYAFWAFVPVILKQYLNLHEEMVFNLPLFSFLIIAVGSLGCIIAGKIAHRSGSKKTAQYALIISGICCVLSPIFFWIPSFPLFISILFVWGMAVIADSPLLSSLVAENAASSLKGTALTIVNSIGFAITIVSIQLLSFLKDVIDEKLIYVILAAGPILGWFALRNQKKSAS